MGAVCGCSRAIEQLAEDSRTWDNNKQLAEDSSSSDNNEQLAEDSSTWDNNEQLAEDSSSSDNNEQLAEDGSSWDNNKRVEVARRARVKWLKRLRRNCATKEEFETTRTQPIFTELNSTSCSSSCPPDGVSPAALQRISEKNRLHFQHLVDTEPSALSYDHPPSVNAIQGISRPGAPGRLRHSLQKLLKSGSSQFYGNFYGKLEAGRKIGGGAQADIHEVIYDGDVLDWCVLKVFRSDCLLVDLQRTWTNNIARLFMGFEHLGDAKQTNCCGIKHGVLLESGRFAFILERCWGDLRKAIDLQIVDHRKHKYFPFPYYTTISIMLGIAQGMAVLHGNNILHRDLKAANCLLLHNPKHKLLAEDSCLVADFECSKGVVGTRFWRAPEVLLVLKNRERDINSIQEVWSKMSDVYSYAMTCYEVLTGCIPFEDRVANDYDGVIGGERPPLPDYVDLELQELIRRCWHSEPSMRPSFNEIVSEIQNHHEKYTFS